MNNTLTPSWNQDDFRTLIVWNDTINEWVWYGFVSNGIIYNN